jgi:hypothetical protein
LSGASGPPRGALRAIVLAITLVTIVVFATLGFSLYEVVVSPGTNNTPSLGGNVRESIAWDNGSVFLSTTGLLSNGGFYPLQYSISLNASDDGQGLGNGSSPTISVAPFQTEHLNSTLAVGLFSNGGGAADALFYNGSSVDISLAYKSDFEPLLTLVVVDNSSTPLPAVLADTRVVSANRTAASGGLAVELSFSDGQASPVGFSMNASLDGLLNSTTVTGLALPGQTSSVDLVFGAPLGGQAISQGRHALTLHTSAFGHDFVTTLLVEVPS